MKNAEKVEEIFDEYAVEFSDWLNENYNHYHGDNEYYCHIENKWYKSKELLLIFKKEKGL